MTVAVPTSTERRSARPSRPGRVVIGLASAVQVLLQLVAVVSIVRRRPEAINGPKWFWLLASFVNFVGPAAYLLAGRKLHK